MPREVSDHQSHLRWEGSGDAEEAGRAVLLKMTRRKWRLVRAAWVTFEFLGEGHVCVSSDEHFGG